MAVLQWLFKIVSAAMRQQSIFDKILKAELEKAVAECERLREENARLRARKKRPQKPVVGSLCGATR